MLKPLISAEDYMNMRQKKQKNQNKPLIGISIGDVHGIGPEVVIKSLSDSRILNYFVPVIYASGSLISFYRKSLSLDTFNYHQCDDISGINPNKINVINAWKDRFEITPGNGSKESGKYARISLEQAVADLKSESIHGIVTAPLSKELTKDENFDFPGHTEYLTSEFNSKESLMLMILEDFRVGVVTGHIPLKEVSHKIDKDLLKAKIDIFLKSLEKDFEIKKPKLAIMGLNPHAGENGILGSEDEMIIKPVIEEYRQRGQLVMGPFPADGFFGSGQYKNFDGILAMYHDQGLIPFKSISGGEGVNFTAGLPVIRTSPAHGTAFSLAGKNVADPASMRNALFSAIELCRNRMPEGTSES